MLIALSADMEGISQLRDPHSILAFERSYWVDGRRQMTADVAAAATGLLRGGAEEVVVLDNHGSGNPENVIASELPDGVRLEPWNVFDLAERGVDAMLQVGYHARAGVPAYISHTYVPGLRLRVNGELISESHGRIWAAGIPLLGIIGNDGHERTLGSLATTPYLVVQRTNSSSEMESVFNEQASASEAITAFSAEALQNGGTMPVPPAEPLFEASFDEGSAELADIGAGWRQTSETECEVQLDAWGAAREPLAAAMGAAFGPWLPYFGTHDLSSLQALERVHDDPVLGEGREHFRAWLAADHPEWVSSRER